MKRITQHPLMAASLVALLLLPLLGLALPTAHSASATILVTAVYYDTYLTNEPDETFRLMNVSDTPVDLSGWTVTDGEGTITLDGTLAGGMSVWIAREAAAFDVEFGFSPDYEYGADADPAVPNLAESGNLALANTGDEVILSHSVGTEVDCAVYKGGDPTAPPRSFSDPTMVAPSRPPPARHAGWPTAQ